MSGVNPTNSHCSRTYWTPTMERYFVDLMLEHIHRGNRIGHTFNKQAWTDMLAVFNVKFGSQYDKDVLKGRYTNLWKLFNDVKILLSQDGFSWDETRQMVVADDYLWEAYIKSHPEARPYRTKSVHNFDDLCLIYGYTVADGRYSRSSHDVDVADDVQGMKFGDSNNSVAPSSSSRMEWRPDMDQYFIELMLKQQEIGNKVGNTFTKQAWTDMLALFNARFSFEYNKRVLRHRYKKLPKYYTDLMTLAKQNGFCWDQKQEMVVADDDVWDSYTKAHPYARSYRGKVFPGYNNLALIFGEILSTGNLSDSHQVIKNEAMVAKGSERSRTYWTPPMDHFLIDLMLEQVRRGNRIGQSFITQAWNDMAESFNAKFNSNHDREILKNRFKHFRKQYNDVRTLLLHGGFSWDSGREMVTAEDHVWDSYIKEHPDARLYRVKTIPCYDKLCLIYGVIKSDGLHSCLVHSIEPAVASSCEGKEDESHVSAEPVPDWTPSMDRCFLDLMLEQVHHGHKIGNTFFEQAWSHMPPSFKEKFGAQYKQHVLENRYLTLMKQYNEIRDLLNQEGFSLHVSSNTTIIAEEDTWELYAKEHPEAISYKNKIIEHYTELCAIFGRTELDYRNDVEMDLEQHPVDIKIDECCGDFSGPFLETEMYDQGKKRPPSTSIDSEKVGKTWKKRLHGDLTNYLAMESAIDALQAIPDIDDELLLDGCDLLEDERKAKTFLALDASLRKKWLLRKLRHS